MAYLSQYANCGTSIETPQQASDYETMLGRCAFQGGKGAMGGKGPAAVLGAAGDAGFLALAGLFVCLTIAVELAAVMRNRNDC